MKLLSVLTRLGKSDPELKKLFCRYIYIEEIYTKPNGLIVPSAIDKNKLKLNEVFGSFIEKYTDENVDLYIDKEHICEAFNVYVNSNGIFGTDTMVKNTDINTLGKIVYLSHRGYNLDMVQSAKDIDVMYDLSYMEDTKKVIETLMKTYNVNNQSFINFFFQHHTQIANTYNDKYYGDIKTFDSYINFIIGKAKTVNEIKNKLTTQLELHIGYSVYLYLKAELIVSESLARELIEEFGYVRYGRSKLEWVEKVISYLRSRGMYNYKFLDIEIDILSEDKYNYGICARWNKFISSNKYVNEFLYGNEHVIKNFNEKPIDVPITHRWNIHKDKNVQYDGKIIVVIDGKDLNTDKTNTLHKAPNPSTSVKNSTLHKNPSFSNKKLTTYKKPSTINKKLAKHDDMIYDSIYPKIVFRYFSNTIGYVLISTKNIFPDFTMDKRKKLIPFDAPLSYRTQSYSLISYCSMFNITLDTKRYMDMIDKKLATMKLDEIKEFCSRYMIYLKAVSKNSSSFMLYTIRFTKYIKTNFKFLREYNDPYMNILSIYISSKHINNKSRKVTKENLLFMFNTLYNLYLTVIDNYNLSLFGEYHKDVYKKLYNTIYSNYTKKIVSANNKTNEKTTKKIIIKQNNIINFNDL